MAPYGELVRAKHWVVYADGADRGGQFERIATHACQEDVDALRATFVTDPANREGQDRCRRGRLMPDALAARLELAFDRIDDFVTVQSPLSR